MSSLVGSRRKPFPWRARRDLNPRPLALPKPTEGQRPSPAGPRAQKGRGLGWSRGPDLNRRHSGFCRPGRLRTPPNWAESTAGSFLRANRPLPGSPHPRVGRVLSYRGSKIHWFLAADLNLVALKAKFITSRRDLVFGGLGDGARMRAYARREAQSGRAPVGRA